MSNTRFIDAPTAACTTYIDMHPTRGRREFTRHASTTSLSKRARCPEKHCSTPCIHGDNIDSTDTGTTVETLIVGN